MRVLLGCGILLFARLLGLFFFSVVVAARFEYKE